MKRTMVIAPTHAIFSHWLREQENIAERSLHREYRHAQVDRDLWGLNPNTTRIVILWYPGDNTPVSPARKNLFEEVDRLRAMYPTMEFEAIRV